MKQVIYTETAAREIKDFVDDCDGDTLAAVYQYCFASISSCVYDDGGDNLEVEYHEGLEPKE